MTWKFRGQISWRTSQCWSNSNRTKSVHTDSSQPTTFVNSQCYRLTIVRVTQDLGVLSSMFYTRKYEQNFLGNTFISACQSCLSWKLPSNMYRTGEYRGRGITAKLVVCFRGNFLLHMRNILLRIKPIFADLASSSWKLSLSDRWKPSTNHHVILTWIHYPFMILTIQIRFFFCHYSVLEDNNQKQTTPRQV